MRNKSKTTLFTQIISFTLIPLIFLSCQSKASTNSYQSFKTEKSTNLGEIYDEAARYEGPSRNPVIVIPGFLGSRLINPADSKIVWGNFSLTPIASIVKGGTKLLSDSSLPINAKEITPLALPMEYGKRLGDIKDDAIPDGVLNEVHINYVGLSLRFGAYSYITDALGAGNYRAAPRNIKKDIDYGPNYFTSFEFSYDWRQDLTQTAKQLHKFIEEKKAYLQKQYEKRYGIKNSEIKFDIVAHSMAGLLTRYYLRYGTADLPADGSNPKLTWAGAKNIDELIIVATPNAGYLDTFLELINGLKTAPLPKFKYSPAVVGTWATYYMMLPAPGGNPSVVDEKNPDGPELDIFDPNLWIKMKWGLANPKYDNFLKLLLPEAKTPEERRKIALDHLTKCLKNAKQFINAMGIDARPPKGTTLHLFAGDPVATNSKVGVNMKTGKIKVLETAPGDGVVLRSSALYDTRPSKDWKPGLKSPICWTSVTFLFGAHMAVTKDPVFIDNVLFLLLDEPKSS